MMTTQESHAKPQKSAKARKLFAAAWRGTKAFLRISPLLAAPAFAQTSQDSAKAADEAFFNGSLAAKSIVRVYDAKEGKSMGVGAGFAGGLEVGKIGAIEATFTGVKRTGVSGMKVEEASVSAIVPAGSFVIVPYLYSDQYFGVTEATPGVAVKGFDVAKIGVEMGRGFWVAYGKALLGPVTVGVAGVGWNDNGTRGGPVQKVAFDFNTNAAIGKVTVSSEARCGILLKDGSKSTVFRVTVSVPLLQ